MLVFVSGLLAGGRLGNITDSGTYHRPPRGGKVKSKPFLAPSTRKEVELFRDMEHPRNIVCVAGGPPSLQLLGFATGAS